MYTYIHIYIYIYTYIYIYVERERDIDIDIDIYIYIHIHIGPILDDGERVVIVGTSGRRAPASAGKCTNCITVPQNTVIGDGSNWIQNTLLTVPRIDILDSEYGRCRILGFVQFPA